MSPPLNIASAIAIENAVDADLRATGNEEGSNVDLVIGRRELERGGGKENIKHKRSRHAEGEWKRNRRGEDQEEVSHGIFTLKS